MQTSYTIRACLNVESASIVVTKQTKNSSSCKYKRKKIQNFMYFHFCRYTQMLKFTHFLRKTFVEKNSAIKKLRTFCNSGQRLGNSSRLGERKGPWRTHSLTQSLTESGWLIPRICRSHRGQGVKYSGCMGRRAVASRNNLVLCI